METRIIKRSDMDRCPIHSMSPKHYRDDGTCLCPIPWRVTIDTLDEQWVYEVEAPTVHEANMKANALAAEDGYDCRTARAVTYRTEPLA